MSKRQAHQVAVAEPALPIAWAMGLGNPGAAYEGTRHNAGAMALRALASQSGLSWRLDASRRGELSHWEKVGLLIPTTWMNESGKSAGALSSKDGERGSSLLVIHDEVELEPGELRLKFGGGLAGHNGLRSIAAALGTQDFWRLRIGVGHPMRAGSGKSVADWSLSKPAPDDKASLERAYVKIEEAFAHLAQGAWVEARGILGK